MFKSFSAAIIGFLVAVGIVKNGDTHPFETPLAQLSPTENVQMSLAAGPKEYSQQELIDLAGPWQESLPVGDKKYVTAGPKKGYIYMCRIMNGGKGAQHIGSWVHGDVWYPSEKPSVQGAVNWPTASFSQTIQGNMRLITGNNLPLYNTSGTFPIRSTDPAWAYDRNPNTISAQSIHQELPVYPVYQDQPNCMGGEVGMMLDGVALFNGFDADSRDAAAHEVQDSCQAHPQEAGEYHYHSLSSCITDIDEQHVIGFALDGFPITGPKVAENKYLSTEDLDECHGLTSQIILDGKTTTMYHYVMTQDFPYSVSCFRGKPASLQVIQNQTKSPQKQSNQSQEKGKTPPQEAVSACAGKTTNANCQFQTPNGSVSGECRIPPAQSTVVCVPN